MLYRFVQAVEHKLQVAGKEISGGETVELDPEVAGQFAPGVLEPAGEAVSQSQDPEPEPEPELQVDPEDKPVAPGPDVDETQAPDVKVKP